MVSKIEKTWFVAIVATILGSCGNNFQAPVSEQGGRQVVSGPIIVSSNTPAGSFRVQENRPAVFNSEYNQPIRGSTTTAAGITSNSIFSSSPSAVAGQSYRVRAGDNLMSIAFQYDLDFRALARANGLHPPYTIFVDQEINLDISRVVDRQTERNSRLGTAVTNNSVAQAQGTLSGSGGLIRQTIDSNREPDWRWPHQGRIVRGFQADVNKGIDIGGQLGEPVFAAGAGNVVYSGRGVQGSGNLIIIRHSDKYLSAYAHNSEMLVGEGSRVSAGEKIAEIGQNTSGIAMLHFEIRVDGQSVDPAGLLPKR